MRLSKTQLIQSLYTLTVVAILLIAIAYRGGRTHLFLKSDVVEVTVDLEGVQKIFPEASAFQKNKHNIIKVKSGTNDIGEALVSTDFVTDNYGYGGLVPLLIGLDNNGDVIGVELLDNGETYDYLEYVTRANLLQQWDNVALSKVQSHEVDIATGATMSSEAIIKGMKNTAAIFHNASVDHVQDRSVKSIIKDILFLVVVLLSLLFAFGKVNHKFRPFYMLLVVLVIGILLNKTLSQFLLYSWLIDGIPWVMNWQSVLMFVLAIAVSFLGKRKYYCNFLCPMGALQELVNRVSPFKKRALASKWQNVSINEAYLFFIAAMLLFGFTPQLNYFEPFMVFSFKIASYGFFIAGGSIVILSLFFTKPWCALCPTGCVMDTLSYKKISSKK